MILLSGGSGAEPCHDIVEFGDKIMMPRFNEIPIKELEDCRKKLQGGA